MKIPGIIDAHIHFCREEPYFNHIAELAGHENSSEHLKGQYAEHNIVHAVVMGNRGLELSQHNYPDYLSYCIGLDSTCFNTGEIVQQADLVAKHLQRKNCVGIKLYPGYNHFYIYDPVLDPFYQLAMQYKKPVAVHTGLTATSQALLKYSHPMVLDEAAVRYPQVQFVMCHIGNPWLVDAVAIMDKNENVAADLSGLLEGRIANMPDFFARKRGYIDFLKLWLEYLDNYDRLLYGTDWPLANISNYIEFVAHIIPEEQHGKVFFDNANRIYGLGL
ncbi:amidohydrolase family protein [Acetonema longum]|uniref:Amidohydrolase 2 n=1 Tax=Acetonema longum DSM 6540 TaxID=1009370 RepID=F7NHU2_9FIRM|nr:amidohydrolase family protein [Acetonema longum]EGO64467.1 amidohydrolase 2 [Acetonema longum DSM 6540]